MKFYSVRLAKLFRKWPGARYGEYRFLPIFFLLGAALEFTMINWRVGEVNFYAVYKRKQAHRLALERIALNENASESSSETS